MSIYFCKDKQSKLEEAIINENMTTFCYIVIEQVFINNGIESYNKQNAFELSSKIADEYWGNLSEHTYEKNEIIEVADYFYEFINSYIN